MGSDSIDGKPPNSSFVANGHGLVAGQGPNVHLLMTIVY